MIRPLTADDVPALQHLGHVCYFLSRFSEEDVRQQIRKVPYITGFFAEGRLMSSLGFYPFQTYLGGSLTTQGGLGGVVSDPEARHKGYVKELLRTGLNMLHEQGISWSLEYPFDPTYYAKYGYSSLPRDIVVALSPQRLYNRFKAHETQLAFVMPDKASTPATPYPNVLGTLKAIHSAWAPDYHATMARTDTFRDPWGFLIDPAHKLYLSDEAYLVLSIPQGDVPLQVVDYAYSSPSGRCDIFAFLGNFIGQVTQVIMQLPQDEPVLFDHHNTLQDRSPPTQMRVVDVQAALAPMLLQTHLTKAFTLKIYDTFCPWNDQGFRLAPSEITPLGPVAEADVSVKIHALPLLLFGGMGAARAQRLGLAEGNPEHIRALTNLTEPRAVFLPQVEFF